MDTALESFVETVTHSLNREAIWEATNGFVNTIGFDHCSLVTATNDNRKFANPETLTSYSEDFKTAYEKEGMGEIDPFLHFHCFDMGVKQINAKNLSSYPNGSEAHQMFLDHVHANGTTGGIGVPVRTRDQLIFGGWIFSSMESENRLEKLIHEHVATIQLASFFAYERMIAIGGSRNKKYKLSTRERECLLWLSAGLRVSMIAEKLAISESAVNLYIANAKYKLVAKTREQAVAIAILEGEISP